MFLFLFLLWYGMLRYVMVCYDMLVVVRGLDGNGDGDGDEGMEMERWRDGALCVSVYLCIEAMPSSRVGCRDYLGLDYTTLHYSRLGSA